MELEHIKALVQKHFAGCPIEVKEGEPVTQVLAVADNYTASRKIYQALETEFRAEGEHENITVGFRTPKGFKVVANLKSQPKPKKIFQ